MIKAVNWELAGLDSSPACATDVLHSWALFLTKLLLCREPARAWDAVWCWETNKAHPLAGHYTSIFRELQWHVSFVVSFSTGLNLLFIVSASVLPSTKQENFKDSHFHICATPLWCKGHFSACLLEGEATALKRAAQSLCTEKLESHKCEKVSCKNLQKRKICNNEFWGLLLCCFGGFGGLFV